MNRAFRIFIIGGVCAMGIGPALAQETVNLEELEARLKKAQAEDAAQKAEANRKAEAARRAAAEMGTLVIEADAVCMLRIDGEDKGLLYPGEVKTVRVQSGQQLIDCVSTESPQAKVREIREVEAGAKLVLTLSLADKVTREAQAHFSERTEDASGKNAKSRSNVLGLVIESLDADQRRALELSSDEGVLVSRVTGRAAQRAGLRSGDVVLMIGKARVGNVDEAVVAVKSGEPVMLLVRRSDTTQFVTVMPEAEK